MIAYDKESWRATHTNGRIPLSELDQVFPVQFDRDLGGPALMHPEAAAAMSTMLQAAAEQGFPDLGISLSYRTLEKQQEKWANFKAGGNLAATPGTSNHGWAVSADMNWGRLVTLVWLQANARRYGFIADVPSENWHYTYQEGLWNGDTVTEGQLEKLNGLQDDVADLKRFVAGMEGLDDRWTAEASDPEPPEEKHPRWKVGFRLLKRAYNRPRATSP